MSTDQAIRFLSRERKALLKERARLRSVLNLAGNCIADAGKGHTPDWQRLVKRIEAYEDAYSPLGDAE